MNTLSPRPIAALALLLVAATAAVGDTGSVARTTATPSRTTTELKLDDIQSKILMVAFDRFSRRTEKIDSFMVNLTCTHKSCYVDFMKLDPDKSRSLYERMYTGGFSYEISIDGKFLKETLGR